MNTSFSLLHFAYSSFVSQIISSALFLSLFQFLLVCEVCVFVYIWPGAGGVGSNPPSRSRRSPPAVLAVLSDRPGAGLGCRGSSEPPSRPKRSHTWRQVFLSDNMDVYVLKKYLFYLFVTSNQTIKFDHSHKTSEKTNQHWTECSSVCTWSLCILPVQCCFVLLEIDLH